MSGDELFSKKPIENYENQVRDSDFIFKAVTNASQSIEQARQLWTLYVFDKSFTRSGCSDAIKRIERHFGQDYI